MICNSCGNPLEPIHRFCPKCGATVQFQTPPPQPGESPYSAPYTPPQYRAPMGGQMPPKKSFGCGKIILILAIIMVLIGAGIAAAIYYGYRAAEKALKSSEAYTLAVKALKENPEVQEKLGEINDTGFPIGSFSQDAGGSGKAAFVMSVHGSKGSGQYQVELTRSLSVWRLNTGVVRLSNGETIRIVDTRGAPDMPDVPDINSNTNDAGPSARGVISGGVLNAKAITLPKPVYPPIAKTAKASGTVVVQVVVDENGNVVSARAVSGHPLLHAAAVVAARGAKFTPTKLSGKPVKVSGTLTYTFTPE
jgi:TonB family protein